MDKLRAALRALGMHEDGVQTMYCGATGRMLQTPIFSGVISYQKLMHMVDDKLHARSAALP